MKRIKARFYRLSSGAEPVRDWLLGFSKKDRKKIGTDIAVAEYGWPVGLPVCRPLGNGIYEIRSNISGERTIRVLFAINDDEMILLHGFIKKTQKTPKGELDLARERKAKLK
ncbi:MAG TPA: type II toxin-antitoxin system RelE/ParE family toxin [Xanthobacteraceae bacterium]|jgi:phage-related protein|nr:type II toxin-antitoxin system RelE/ParE family toxin [Xanthobacteraceae bacterium]